MAWQLSPKAEDDLAAILDALAARNPRAAAASLDRMERAFEAIGAMPGIGASREDVRPGLRLHPVGRYLILYRMAEPVQPPLVQIVRVIHGARLWQTLV
jgi:toxin ParE1/3/4